MVSDAQVLTEIVKTVLPFSGGHDNGYTTTLTALENEQLLGKLVILQGYNDIANELRNLSLPSLKVEGLFMTQKLSYNAKRSAPLTNPTVNDTTTTNGGHMSPQSPARNGGAQIDPSLVNVIWNYLKVSTS